MKTSVVAMLAVTLVAGVAVPQSAPADLQLVARVIPSTNATQTEVVVTLLNNSDHTVSFPKPALFCHELAGSMTVSSEFRPSDLNSQQNKMAMGCAACNVETSVPDILEQAKGWIVLVAGQSVDVEDRLSKAMIIGDAGTYEVRVSYSAPIFKIRDRKRLREAGIVLPSERKYDSDPVTFEVGTPESDTH
jgi:hypothetical protein